MHVAAGPAGIHITESADPRGTILTTFVQGVRAGEFDHFTA
ncbi:hypothetical protein [Streptomyces pseudogriseolus]